MRKHTRYGFTLIELMIVVAIVGVLAVLATFGVQRYIANAKTAEARAVVGQIGKMAVIAYEKESGSTSTINLGVSGSTAQRNLCTTAPNAVPTSLAAVANKKYQSDSREWRVGNMSTGWACLSFHIDGPQYYQYQYSGVNIDSRTGTFSVVAHGDLDGDGSPSTFSLAGAVDMGQPRIAPSMDESDSEE